MKVFEISEYAACTCVVCSTLASFLGASFLVACSK
jgi:hypothetical protein